MFMRVGSHATGSSKGSKSKIEKVYFPVAAPVLMRSNQILLILT